MRRLQPSVPLVLLLLVPTALAAPAPFDGAYVDADLRDDGLGPVRDAAGALLVTSVATNGGAWTVDAVGARFASPSVELVLLDIPGGSVTAHSASGTTIRLTFPATATLTPAVGGRYLVEGTARPGILTPAGGANLTLSGKTITAALPAGAGVSLAFPVDEMVRDVMLARPHVADVRVGASSALASAGAAVETSTDRVFLSVPVPEGLGLVRARIAATAFGPVERLRQITPTVDETLLAEGTSRYGVETKRAGIGEIEGDSGPFYNMTREGDDLAILMLARGPGTLNLTLQRDLESPEILSAQVSAVTARSFLVVTRTSEPALAQLDIWPVERPDDVVPFPTPTPARIQNFPVQGLDPATAYEYRITVRDFGGNVNETELYNITTPALPFVDPPTVVTRTPEPNATLSVAPDAIVATFSTPVGTIDPQSDVRLFVDKTEVSHLALRTPTTIRYVPPEPLKPGKHSIGLEVTNSEGGKTVSTWTFEIEPKRTHAPPLALFLLAVVAVGWLRRR